MMRESWQKIAAHEGPWDVVVVGGGITGAGILREASRRGLKAVLVEQRDFAWGTSSRSSKMVHGGLRYIAQLDVKLTKHSVMERERLIKEAPGLVERLGYLFTIRKGQFPGKLIFNGLLAVYDSLAGIKSHDFFENDALKRRAPGIETKDLKGASYYTDAVTDDARLTMQVLHAAIRDGGMILNYARATELIREGNRVVGVRVRDHDSGTEMSLKTRVVINATGAWVDRLRTQLGHAKQIRPLRGSHLVIPRVKAPVTDSLTLFHPRDKRPVFLFPWEGTTIIGTTDLDHEKDLDLEPAISQQEVDYLLQAAHSLFPDAHLGEKDIISTWAGVRPVISQNKGKDPSKESREHDVWSDNGLITVSGGKLTTFRLIALDVLNAAAPQLGPLPKPREDRVLRQASVRPQELPFRDAVIAQRMTGRYGDDARAMFANVPAEHLALLEDTHFCLAELAWIAGHEWVEHLDDLLLRRTRIGNLLPHGGRDHLPEIKAACQTALGWDDARWDAEVARYLRLWETCYYLPSRRPA